MRFSRRRPSVQNYWSAYPIYTCRRSNLLRLNDRLRRRRRDSYIDFEWDYQREFDAGVERDG